MSIRRVTALVLAAMIAGVVLGGIGIANATSKATTKPAVQAFRQGACASTTCPSSTGQCDRSQRGSGNCAMNRAAAKCGSGNCAVSGAAPNSSACGPGACGVKQ
jgi:uncharacterized low-complexity protein